MRCFCPDDKKIRDFHLGHIENTTKNGFVSQIRQQRPKYEYAMLIKAHLVYDNISPLGLGDHFKEKSISNVASSHRF